MNSAPLESGSSTLSTGILFSNDSDCGFVEYSLLQAPLPFSSAVFSLVPPLTTGSSVSDAALMGTSPRKSSVWLDLRYSQPVRASLESNDWLLIFASILLMHFLELSFLFCGSPASSAALSNSSVGDVSDIFFLSNSCSVFASENNDLLSISLSTSSSSFMSKSWFSLLYAEGTGAVTLTLACFSFSLKARTKAAFSGVILARTFSIASASINSTALRMSGVIVATMASDPPLAPGSPVLPLPPSKATCSTAAPSRDTSFSCLDSALGHTANSDILGLSFPTEEACSVAGPVAIVPANDSASISSSLTFSLASSFSGSLSFFSISALVSVTSLLSSDAAVALVATSPPHFEINSELGSISASCSSSMTCTPAWVQTIFIPSPSVVTFTTSTKVDSTSTAVLSSPFTSAASIKMPSMWLLTFPS